MADDVLYGSCLCGAVQLELAGPPAELLHCHCRMCQKAHGAAFATFAMLRPDQLTITRGAGCIETYRSSPGIDRRFCGLCGSTLAFARAGADRVGLAASVIDSELPALPGRHVYEASRVSWLP